jgi:hypothetical protein
MATAVYTAPIQGVSSMNTITPHLSTSELLDVVRKIHALRRVTKTTGFMTTNEIVKMLKGLSTDDLIAVGEQLKLKPREMAEVKQ